MSELRKANTDATYFLTFTVVGWIDLFTRSRYCDEVLKSLSFCQENKGLDIFAYVIMPSHIHTVARSLDASLSSIIRDFKSFTAKRIIEIIETEQGESRKNWLLHMFRYHAKFKNQNKLYQLWQKTSHRTELYNPEMIDQKIDYIHNNPVESGLVTRPECWQYSSACEMQLLNILPT